MADHSQGQISRIALSYWTIFIAGIVLFLLHVWWFVAIPANRHSEVVSGFGATLIVLGIVLAAQPFLRKGFGRGLEEMTGRAMRPLFGFTASPGYHEEREAQRPQVRRDVIVERVIAVILIAIGTLLNGYAAPVARMLG